MTKKELKQFKMDCLQACKSEESKPVKEMSLYEQILLRIERERSRFPDIDQDL